MFAVSSQEVPVHCEHSLAFIQMLNVSDNAFAVVKTPSVALIGNSRKFFRCWKLEYDIQLCLRCAAVKGDCIFEIP